VPPSAPPSPISSWWPIANGARPILTSSTFSPPAMLVPERQPIYRSSTSKEEALSPTSVGGVL
jgi:hypothetical protein